MILNRPTEHGVEVVATAEDTLVDLSNGGQSPLPPAAAQQRAAQPSFKEVANQVEQDADQLAMSTLSFQDYVRERMARKRQDAIQQEPQEKPAIPSAPARTVAEPVQDGSTTEPASAQTRRRTRAQIGPGHGAPERHAAEHRERAARHEGPD